jgi:protocatechuate 3,4-dioxygenase beta subunit
MNRRDLLKGLGVVGLGSVLPIKKALGAEAKAKNLLAATTCFLTPQETEGPYYFDANLVRQDIRQDITTSVIKTGLPLSMVFTVINADCDPIPNVLVDIWHCDKDGVYSGYAGQPGGNTVGQTFLRGIQMTDANGQCTFSSIYPGWYPGRVTHVHFKVRLTSTTYVTSQFAFPDAVNAAVYNTALYVAKGQNSLTNATDSIFGSANPENQVMAVTPNATTGGYEGAFTIGINAPTTGINESNVEPGGFRLNQNFPNPFNPSTTITYHLPSSSDVKLVVYDTLGREVATLVDEKKSAGTHEIKFEGSKLSSGFYIYKLSAGSFVEAKEMLLIK